ncbi:Organ specific protein [Melia azedarach]|uniref:Organ specific protein n=1 Tax=Melia azedarach TaxID=155640 RepID=A0ACC1XZ97_MELAZ|nr:Organ specific protein [Melia azedarach]
MMNSTKAFCALFSLLLLFANTIDARKDLGEYWRGVMKDQVMPESIQSLIPDSTVSNINVKADCHNSEDLERKMEKSFVKTFEPKADISISDNDVKSHQQKYYFLRNFELMPDLSMYDNGNKQTQGNFFVKDFQLMPDLTIYDNKINPTEQKYAENNLESKPDATIYHG